MSTIFLFSMNISWNRRNLFAVIIALVIFAQVNGNGNDSGLDWAEHIVPSNYWKLIPPKIQVLNALKPTKVNIWFTPKSVMSMEPTTMDFVVHLDLSVNWTDERMIVPPDLPRMSSSEIDLSSEVATKLWTPVLHFKNCKGCASLLIQPSTQSFKLFSRTKIIEVSFTDIITFACTLDLRSYPFDKQHCKVILELRSRLTPRVRIVSFGSIRDRIEDHENIYVPPEFLLKAVTFHNRTNNSDTTKDCIEYIFHFRRLISHHVMVVFIPSQLLVMLSWVSFWLDIEVAAPRVALALTTLLTLTTQFNNAQRNLPAVSYIKALDIWMFACMFMVFSSLIEFAVANNFHIKWKYSASSSKTVRSETKEQMTKQKKTACKDKWCAVLHKWARRRAQIHSRTFRKNDSRRYPASHQTPKKCPSPPNYQNAEQNQVSPIDRVSRVVFPTVFVVFNAVYWGYYKD